MRSVRTALAAAAACAVLALPGTWAGAARTPAGTVAGVGSLNAIACPTSTRCIAVGADASNNGKAVVVNTANSAGTAGPGRLANLSLEGVACAVPTTCVAVAVGTIERVNVANGALSAAGKVPAPSGQIAPVQEVACPSSAECFAVGWIGTYGHSRALVVRLSATGAVQATTQLPGTTGIGSIACPTSTTCLMAVANGGTAAEKIQLLTNGHPGAARTLPSNIYIQALACDHGTKCFAIAGSRSGNSSKTNLLYELSPLTGAVIAKHSIGGGFSADGIACPTATECIITGFAATKPSIVITANGVPGAPRKVGGSSVSGLACTASALCFAVGETGATALVEKV
jgi:hypothetical protein